MLHADARLGMQGPAKKKVKDKHGLNSPVGSGQYSDGLQTNLRRTTDEF